METVAATLALAEQHHCKDPREACIEFLAPRDVNRGIQTFGRKLSFGHHRVTGRAVPSWLVSARGQIIASATSYEGC
jgi:hypothetical protein